MNKNYLTGRLFKKMGQLELAIPLFENASKLGHIKSQLELGDIFSIKNDNVKCKYWYKKAFDNDNSNSLALYKLGKMYLSWSTVYNITPIGVVLSNNIPLLIQARKWFKLAAEQGHIRAGYELGTLNRYYFIPDVDFDEAAKWYRFAAELGDVDSMFELGMLYHYDLEPDYKEAEKWYLKFKENGGKVDCFLKDVQDKLKEIDNE